NRNSNCGTVSFYLQLPSNKSYFAVPTATPDLFRLAVYLTVLLLTYAVPPKTRLIGRLCKTPFCTVLFKPYFSKDFWNVPFCSLTAKVEICAATGSPFFCLIETFATPFISDAGLDGIFAAPLASSVNTVA